MYKIFSVGILFVLCCSCTQDKKNVGPAASDFPVEIDLVDSTAHPAVPEPFQHAYLAKADSLRNQRAYNEAIPLYQEAAKKFELDENWEGMVKAVNEWGHGLYRIYETDSAISILLVYLDEAEKTLNQAHPLIAETHFYLGKCYYQGHKTELSLKHHNKSLKIKTDLFGEEALELVDNYWGLGNVYMRRLNDLYQAEMYFKKAVFILENNHGNETGLASIFKI